MKQRAARWAMAAWVACTSSVAALDTERLVITPGNGLGSVKLGSTKKEVLSTFGEPERGGSDGSTTMQYRDAVAITFDKTERVSMIACGWWCFSDTEQAKAHPFKGRLSSGPRLGDAQEEVLKIFGTPSRRRVVNQEQVFESFSFAKMGVVLSFKAGKLAHVMIVPPRKADEDKPGVDRP